MSGVFVQRLTASRTIASNWVMTRFVRSGGGVMKNLAPNRECHVCARGRGFQPFDLQTGVSRFIDNLVKKVSRRVVFSLPLP